MYLWLINDWISPVHCYLGACNGLTKQTIKKFAASALLYALMHKETKKIHILLNNLCPGQYKEGAC